MQKYRLDLEIELRGAGLDEDLRSRLVQNLKQMVASLEAGPVPIVLQGGMTGGDHDYTNMKMTGWRGIWHVVPIDS